MLLVHLFVCFVHVCFCHFSLPLGVGGWLRFVIVAIPGLFYYFFESFIYMMKQLHVHVYALSYIDSNNKDTDKRHFRCTVLSLLLMFL